MNSILFDLDGTLLPMDLDEFTRYYFSAIGKTFTGLGYDADIAVQAVYAGTKAMYKNDGTMTNEDAFWNTFTIFSGIAKEQVIDIFDAFYRTDFQALADLTARSETMIQAVQAAKAKGYRLYLATNPLFPAIATRSRLQWAGLHPDDFLDISTYETYHACKPNLRYFEEVLAHNGLRPEDCMMVGNDAQEDGVAETLGIPLYLVTDHLLNRTGEPLHSKWHGNAEDFASFIQALPQPVSKA